MADRQWLIIVKPQRLPTVSAEESGSFVVGRCREGRYQTSLSSHRRRLDLRWRLRHARPRRLPKAQTGESSGDPAGATQQ
jgi:hypothetical protein